MGRKAETLALVSTTDLSYSSLKRLLSCHLIWPRIAIGPYPVRSKIVRQDQEALPMPLSRRRGAPSRCYGQGQRRRAYGEQVKEELPDRGAVPALRETSGAGGKSCPAGLPDRRDLELVADLAHACEFLGRRGRPLLLLLTLHAPVQPHLAPVGLDGNAVERGDLFGQPQFDRCREGAFSAVLLSSLNVVPGQHHDDEGDDSERPQSCVHGNPPLSRSPVEEVIHWDRWGSSTDKHARSGGRLLRARRAPCQPC
jgi:hypothetical protein